MSDQSKGAALDDNDANDANDVNDAEVVADAPELQRAGAPADGHQRKYPCRACGFQMVVPPGVDALRCEACGNQESIPLTEATIQERSLDDFVAPVRKRGLGAADHVMCRCASCGASMQALPEIITQPCAFCGGHLSTEADTTDEDIHPDALVPFQVDRSRAQACMRTWLAKRWFAPSDVRHLSTLDVFQDRFLPHFTFDSHTVSHYSGEAGHYYYVTVGSGKNRRQVRRTRWHRRSGVHEEFFDDVLIAGGPFGSGDTKWQLQAAKPYSSERLAGSTALRTLTDPAKKWPEAKTDIAQRLYATCCRHIGGDTQRGVSVTTAHRAVTWKLLLLPRWEGGFRYRSKRYRITVNGQTGTVQGDRPYSWIKITCASIAAAIVVAAIAWAVISSERRSNTGSSYQPHSAPSTPMSPPSRETPGRFDVE